MGDLNHTKGISLSEFPEGEARSLPSNDKFFVNLVIFQEHSKYPRSLVQGVEIQTFKNPTVLGMDNAGNIDMLGMGSG
jgi:hypothetical protein